MQYKFELTFIQYTYTIRVCFKISATYYKHLRHTKAKTQSWPKNVIQFNSFKCLVKKIHEYWSLGQCSLLLKPISKIFCDLSVTFWVNLRGCKFCLVRAIAVHLSTWSEMDGVFVLKITLRNLMPPNPWRVEVPIQEDMLSMKHKFNIMDTNSLLLFWN